MLCDLLFGELACQCLQHERQSIRFLYRTSSSLRNTYACRSSYCLHTFTTVSASVLRFVHSLNQSNQLSQPDVSFILHASHPQQHRIPPHHFLIGTNLGREMRRNVAQAMKMTSLPSSINTDIKTGRVTVTLDKTTAS